MLTALVRGDTVVAFVLWAPLPRTGTAVGGHSSLETTSAPLILRLAADIYTSRLPAAE